MKYVCCECGEVFDENSAGLRSELIDHFAGYGNYYEHYYTCPECGSDWLEKHTEVNSNEK